MVIATDGLRRKIRGKKQTGAGVVIKRGERIIWKGAWGLVRRSNTYHGKSFTLAAGMSIANLLKPSIDETRPR